MRRKLIILMVIAMLGLLTACSSSNDATHEADKEKIEGSAKPTEKSNLLEDKDVTASPTPKTSEQKTSEPKIPETTTLELKTPAPKTPTPKTPAPKTQAPSKDAKGQNLDKNDKLYAKAYIKAIKAYEKKHENAEYDLIDFNGDNVPELVAGVSGYFIDMYTYINGKLIVVIDDWSYGVGGNSGYEYLPGKNVMRNYNSDFAGLTMNLAYMIMNKKYDLEEKYNHDLVMQFWKDENNNDMPDDGEELTDPLYFLGTKEISEEEYDSYMIEGDFKSITGEITAKEMIEKLEK